MLGRDQISGRDLNEADPFHRNTSGKVGKKGTHAQMPASFLTPLVGVSSKDGKL